MSYEDLSNEKKPIKKLLISEGWRNQKIASVSYGVSKKGNPQFIFGMFDSEKNYTTDLYAINVSGKRWLLKSILDCCGYEKVEDKYDLSEESVIKATKDKELCCLFEHEDNEWINKDGEAIHTMQHKIVDFKPIEEVAWDENK